MSSHQVDRVKWANYSLLNQLGNIGSEVGRALNAKKTGDQKRMEGAFYRGLDLFDASAEVEILAHRRREILRAREQFVEAILTDKEDSTLEKYFMEYAIAARMKTLTDRANSLTNTK